MKNKMKVPKGMNEKLLSNDAEATLIGVMLLLLSLIGLLGKGPVGQFLQYCIVFVFGNFYFIVYALLFFFSIYLIVTKKIFIVRLNLYLLAALLILFSFLIGASSSNVELTIANFSTIYMTNLNATPGIELFKIESFEAISYTGGGYLGYMLKGFLNTCFTSVGTSITIGVFAFVGIGIFVKDLVAFTIKGFIALKEKFIRIEKKAKQIRVEEVKEEKEEKIVSIPESAPFEEVITRDIPPVNEKEIIEEELVEPFVDDIEEQEESISYQSETIQIEEPKSTYDFNEPIETVVSQEVSPIKHPIEEKTEVKSFDDIVNDLSNYNYRSEEELSEEENTSQYSDYELPPLSLLSNEFNNDVSVENRIIAEQRLEKINNLFQEFKIGANAISYTIGPSCTRFNIKMNSGVKVNVLSSIQNELAIRLDGNKTVRLELVVEGRDTSSIEVGNAKASSVSYRECLKTLQNRTSEKDRLLVPLGKGIEGNVVTVSLDELPHLLVAGTTGSGKSVFINTIITTLLMRNRPDELKLMLIDPKKVEFSKYNDLPHLLCPVISEAYEGKNALKRLVEEMERRYSLFLTKGKGASKLSEYNELASTYGYDKLPNIVMICDEFSDFMSEHGKEIEPLIKRLAQKARACGIYLIICTQRPSVNVITGDIKAVIPSRIGLLVPQVNDSRTILDEGGAESLLGYGDMLCRIPRHNSLVRVQGANIKNSEIIAVCEFIRNQHSVDYDHNFTDLNQMDDYGVVGSFDGINRREKDVLHETVKKYVIETQIASTSKLQSAFGIGYGRADHILNCLQDEGVLGKAPGNRRIVLMTMEEYEKQNKDKE